MFSTHTKSNSLSDRHMPSGPSSFTCRPHRRPADVKPHLFSILLFISNLYSSFLSRPGPLVAHLRHKAGYSITTGLADSTCTITQVEPDRAPYRAAQPVTVSPPSQTKITGRFPSKSANTVPALPSHNSEDLSSSRQDSLLSPLALGFDPVIATACGTHSTPPWTLTVLRYSPCEHCCVLRAAALDQNSALSRHVCRVSHFSLHRLPRYVCEL